jgi:hypothetical protein
MDVKATTQSLEEIDVQALVVPVFKDEKPAAGLLKKLDSAVGGLIASVRIYGQGSRDCLLSFVRKWIEGAAAAPNRLWRAQRLQSTSDFTDGRERRPLLKKQEREINRYCSPDQSQSRKDSANGYRRRHHGFI